VAYELTIPSRDDEPGGRVYSVNYEPHRNAQGERLVVVVVVDVTENRRTAAAVREQQARLEGIVNSAMDGIITVDEERRILLSNPAAEGMFGAERGRMLGRSVDDFVPAPVRERHASLFGAFAQRGDSSAHHMSTSGPVEGVRLDGEHFPLEATISQVVVEGRRLFTVICRDVTERVQESEARRLLEAQLQQSQKMEAFGQLAGGVAHDFNNLLTVITGYCDILLRSGERSDDDREALAEILEAGERASALTRQLLAFTRQQILAPRRVDLNDVIGNVDRMLRRLIGEDIELTTVLDPTLSDVEVDPRQIEQVVMNLAVNARDAMPRGGRLSIETCEVEVDDRFAAAHPGLHVGRYVRLTIRDNGTGISAEVQRRLFEPFFTTKGVGKGTGLGLSVVLGIVRQSGGSIAVESTVGEGTSFRIFLPLAQAGLESEPDSDVSTLPRGSETVLLVEDDASVRAMIARVLRSAGYTVLVASGGADATRIANDWRGRIDALLTDVVMPGSNGRETAEALLRTRPELKVLYVSGYTDDAVVRGGVERATVDFLQKPFTPSELVRKVREVLFPESATPAR
jgi:PAS domain S-box-containing protein